MKPGQVIRTRRAGNKTRQNYVIASHAAVQPRDYAAVYAHAEYGAGNDVFMLLDLRDAKVLRTY